MPVLVIYGTNEGMFDKLKLLNSKLVEAVTSIEALELKPIDVTCFFPNDLLKERQSKEVIIFVEGLYEKPERTAEVRAELAKQIVIATHSVFELDLIECFIRPFNPEQGFSYMAV